jgi:transcriptional regulator with XRE-family HTH domain
MAGTGYGDLIARNIRAVRARRQLDLRNVEARMRALGFEKWHRGIMGKIERGERRLLAEELLALAYALETSIEALVAPALDERGYIQLGGLVHMEHVASRLRNVSDGAIRWNGDEPVFMVDNAGFRGATGEEDYFADGAAPSERAG